MFDSELTAYSVEKKNESVFPKRSRLYHLEPIGIDTPNIESLTSYITRLANAHTVRTRDLFYKEIVPYVSKKYLPIGINPTSGGFWSTRSSALNGTRALAQGCVEAIESL